jgi:Winged helix-turn-helix DNA-binding
MRLIGIVNLSGCGSERQSVGMRMRTDRLHVRSLGPRELDALGLIEQRPGIPVAELAEAMGMSMARAWQYVGRLELGAGAG